MFRNCWTTCSRQYVRQQFNNMSGASALRAATDPRNVRSHARQNGRQDVRLEVRQHVRQDVIYIVCGKLIKKKSQ